MTGTSLLVLILAAAVFLTLAFVFNRRRLASGPGDPRQGYYDNSGNAMGWAPIGSGGDNGDCSPSDAGSDAGSCDGGGGGDGGGSGGD